MVSPAHPQQSIPRKARLVLMCGLPGAGKTTLARQLATELPAVRFSPDEWIARLQMDLWDQTFRDRLEEQMWRLAQELLAASQSVILDYGFWDRKERDEKRLRARALNVAVELRYLASSVDESARRLQVRNHSEDWSDAPITRAHLETWSAIFEAPDGEELSLFDSCR